MRVVVWLALSLAVTSSAQLIQRRSSALAPLYFRRTHSCIRRNRIQASQSEETRRKFERELEEGVEALRAEMSSDVNSAIEIEYEYDSFTRRAALASLGLWGALTASSTKDLFDDTSSARQSQTYLDKVKTLPEVGLSNGLPSVIEFRQEGQEASIEARLGPSVKSAGGPTQVNYIMIDVDDTKRKDLLKRYNVYSTPTVVWVDPQARLVGAATGDLPEGLLIVNTVSLAQGESLPYRATVLPGAELIRDPVFGNSKDKQASGDLDEQLARLPPALPMEY
uniref:Thioredoxin domain-containing protein n=1 Tax=Lotharella oceanica TaxID=641309 RepID=A0A7S2U0I0_9EUKA